jgi:hypothetical protein
MRRTTTVTLVAAVLLALTAGAALAPPITCPKIPRTRPRWRKCCASSYLPPR